MRRHLLLSVPFMILIYVCSVRSGEQDMDDLIGRFVSGTTPDEVSRASEALLANAADSEVRTFRASPHVALGLRAAWEPVRRSFPASTQEVAAIADVQASSRFTGYCEGRVLVQLPIWWENAVMSARAHRRSSICFSDVAEPPYIKSESGLFVSKGHAVSFQQELLNVSHDGTHCQIPAIEVQLAKKKVSIDAVSAVVEGEWYYVALHSDRSLPYKLMAIDVGKDRLAWTADVWAGGGKKHYSGQGFHWVEIKKRRDELMLFGAADDVVYIEAFACKDGRPLYRFSSAY